MAIRKFNTGRQYTAAGQIIFWEQQPDGTIWMNDVSRGVDYALGAPLDGEPNDHYVLAAYDDRYCHTEPADYTAYYQWVNMTRGLPR